METHTKPGLLRALGELALWTCVDLLRDINRRQELRTHDEQLIRGLLHPDSHAEPDWLPRLERLTGLDDALDAVIVRASAARRRGDDGRAAATVLFGLSVRSGPRRMSAYRFNRMRVAPRS